MNENNIYQKIHKKLYMILSNEDYFSCDKQYQLIERPGYFILRYLHTDELQACHVAQFSVGDITYVSNLDLYTPYISLFFSSGVKTKETKFFTYEKYTKLTSEELFKITLCDNSLSTCIEYNNAISTLPVYEQLCTSRIYLYNEYTLSEVYEILKTF